MLMLMLSNAMAKNANANTDFYKTSETLLCKRLINGERQFLELSRPMAGS